MLKKYLEVGKIVGTHGIKGELKVQPWCDSPDFLCKFDNVYLDFGEKKLGVLNSRINKNIVIMKVDGIFSINDAELLINKVIYIDRNDAKIEEGAYFIQDIIGLRVVDINSKKEYGSVKDVIKTGANDVYEVLSLDGKEYLVPVIDDVVKKIDTDHDVIYISPLKGIFEDAD